METKVVRVRWRDHFEDEGAKTLEEILKEGRDCVHTSVGHLVGDLEDRMILAYHREEIDGEVKWSMIQHIWRALLIGEHEILTAAR
ncbi:MAG: hypothetical protein ACRDJ5_00480 [Actinomycetota bacterium]